MSANGEYKGLWLVLKEKKEVKVKLGSLTKPQLMRALSKEKDEDTEVDVQFMRLKSEEVLDAVGISTGVLKITLQPVKVKTRLGPTLKALHLAGLSLNANKE